MDHPALCLAASGQELQQKLSSSCIVSEPELVFLSHAGKQKPFVFDLYNDFRKWPRFPSIDPFFDKSEKSLPKGEEFPERIFEAAAKCAVAVVILTKEYVTSKWPMLELLAFVEAKKSSNPNLKLLPVFYDGSEIDDSVIAAWKNMEPKSDGTPSARRCKRTTISVELCKEAMRELRSSNGFVLTNDKPLRTLREEIVEGAVKFLPSSSGMDTENVEGCLRLCESICEMLKKNRNGVSCLGLYGVGGLGKTTLCNELCSYLGPRFRHKVCHVDIGSNETDTKEKKFKRHIRILEALSDMSKNEISNLGYQKAEMCVQKWLSDPKPKFLAVDNVQDTLDSCQEAERYLKWISPESIIIITSRSRDNLLSVNCDIHCNPFPNLNQEEALALFLKIAAPGLDRESLDHRRSQILRKCLQICFFPRGEELTQNQIPAEVGGHTLNRGESGHYHPLALRAAAAYFRDRYTGPDSILCWKEELNSGNFRFLHARHSIDIFDVLGLGFNDKNMCDLSKQLFIDVALFAPTNGIFNWLVSIQHEYDPQTIREKLRLLRRKSFLDYDEAGKNFSMHELYKEFAKVYIGKKGEGLFKCGVYDGGDLPPPSLESPGWTRAPRIYLQRLTNVTKVKEWCNAAVVHLFGCETITTVSIGELSSLRSLAIVHCPKLEVLSWTQDSAPKQMWGTKLCFVYLFSNETLRKIPDFSNCSESEKITVERCSRSVEPIRLHTCLKLQVLSVSGNDVPEVQSIRSCPMLTGVQLAWRATHESLPQLDDLRCLSTLEIRGPSDVPFDLMDLNLSHLLGEKQFWKQHPIEHIVYHEISGVGMLTDLHTVELTSIPLGKLPMKLATQGSSLRKLNLSGCLLSTSEDFSAFSNLDHLVIMWTNVEEVCGLEHLSKLEYLDCSYCFRLRKLPDLRPLSKLSNVFFVQCPKLQSIPRLPLGCIRALFPDADDGSEDEVRAIWAALAFAETRALPTPGFGIRSGTPRAIPVSQIYGGWARLHVWLATQCDGCGMSPILGRRYQAKPVATLYSLCSNCFTKTCYCSGRRKPRWKAEGKLKVDYDLCYSCYAMSGCSLLDFLEIDKTHRLDHNQGTGSKVILIKEGSTLKMSVSGVSRRSRDRVSFGPSHFTLKINESPFTVRRKVLVKLT